jgi:hypothetical protein
MQVDQHSLEVAKVAGVARKWVLVDHIVEAWVPICPGMEDKVVVLRRTMFGHHLHIAVHMFAELVLATSRVHGFETFGSCAERLVDANTKLHKSAGSVGPVEDFVGL